MQTVWASTKWLDLETSYRMSFFSKHWGVKMPGKQSAMKLCSQLNGGLDTQVRIGGSWLSFITPLSSPLHSSLTIFLFTLF